MPERKPPDPDKFTTLSTLTTDQLNSMTNAELRTIHTDINDIWNFCLYPVVVTIMELLRLRCVMPPTQERPAERAFMDALRKAGIGEDEVENLISSIIERK